MALSRRTGWNAGPLSMFAAMSVVAVGVGVGVAARYGASIGEVTRNVAAWALAGLAALALARWSARRAGLVVLGLALTGLTLCFIRPGLQGVHRWINLGPLRMNVAEALMPAFVVAYAARDFGPRMLGLAVAVLALLAAQPDTSQTVAFGAALLAAVFARSGKLPERLTLIGFAGLAALCAWLRPDPLAPVPNVEGIMGLAWQWSPSLAISASLALVGAMLAPLTLMWGAPAGVRAPAAALTAYGAVAAAAPLVGAFPVPLVGLGVSPILGLWLGMGLLAGLRRPAP